MAEDCLGAVKYARGEVLRRVEALGNKVNLLAFRFLWPLDAKDKDDAWKGLAACCWRAKGNLCIPGFKGKMATEIVISNALERRLAPHKKSGKRTIAQLALDNEFKWTARWVRNDLADYLRSLFRGQRPRGRPSKPRVPPQDNRAFLQTLLQVQRARFVAALGEKFWTILMMLVNVLPLGATKRGWKREATRLIAGRGVSQQQARADKRMMLRLAEGEPVVEGAVREILSGTFVSREKSANRYEASGEVLPDSVPVIAAGPKGSIMRGGVPVSGVCRWCDEQVTGFPVLPNAKFQDLVLTGEGCERRAHWLLPVDQPLSPEACPVSGLPVRQ